MDIKFKKLQEVLLKECKVVFPTIIDELKEEKIYSLSLYNQGGDWGELYPIAFTIEGLNEVVAEYREDEYYEDQSDDELQIDLKWSPCDSPKLEDYIDTLPETQIHLESIVKVMDKLWDEGKEEEYEKLENKLSDICLTVLKTLDENGVFGKLDRSSFVLNLLNGDQSDEERLEYAQRTNPKTVFEMYAKEI